MIVRWVLSTHKASTHMVFDRSHHFKLFISATVWERSPKEDILESEGRHIPAGQEDLMPV